MIVPFPPVLPSLKSSVALPEITPPSVITERGAVLSVAEPANTPILCPNVGPPTLSLRTMLLLKVPENTLLPEAAPAPNRS